MCPALDTLICPGCCAAGREGEIACHMSCEYLISAHQFEKKTANPKEIPDPDISTNQNFLRQNEYLIVTIGAALLHATHLQPDVDDRDLLAVLSSLVSAWRERVPQVMSIPFVCDRAVTMIAGRVAADINAHRQQIVQGGGTCASDSDVLGSLAFLSRTCYGLDNGRPKCRAFLGFLQRATPYEKVKKDEPLVVLA